MGWVSFEGLAGSNRFRLPEPGRSILAEGASGDDLLSQHNSPAASDFERVGGPSSIKLRIARPRHPLRQRVAIHMDELDQPSWLAMGSLLPGDAFALAFDAIAASCDTSPMGQAMDRRAGGSGDCAHQTVNGPELVAFGQTTTSGERKPPPRTERHVLAARRTNPVAIPCRYLRASSREPRGAPRMLIRSACVDCPPEAMPGSMR
jgi:hypothetical protein